MLQAVRDFYRGRIAIGDRLGEAFYAVWMVVVSIGILNSTGMITPALVVAVIATSFAVNIGWGMIDGLTVMYSNIIERAVRDRLVHDLRAGGDEGAARKRAHAALQDTIVAVLPEAERERVLDLIAASQGGSGSDPDRRRYRAGRDDWAYAAGIFAIDVLLVVPMVAPLALIPDAQAAIYVSQLIATLLLAATGAGYARNLNRNPWLAALFLGALGFAGFTAAFAAGW